MMGPLTRIARQHRESVRAREIAAEAAKLPPRVEERRVPAISPIPQPLGDLRRPEEVWREIDLSDCPKCGNPGRPAHRVQCVPIVPPPEAVIRHGGSVPNLMVRMTEHALFQAMPYSLDIPQPGGGTRVCWWGWEPVAEAYKPEVRRGLHRSAAYAERIRFCFEQTFGPKHPGVDDTDPWDILVNAANERRWGDFRVVELRAWLDVILEDLEQAMGKP